MGFTDDKDAARTIRMEFTLVVSHDTWEFMEICFLMNESLYKGYQAWVSQMALFAVRGYPTAIFGNLTAAL